MLEICALASGSNGNCYYIGNEQDAILVDAGISTKQILKRMYDRNLDFRKVKAVLISHEHSDHVRGVRVLTKKLGIPAFFTKETFYAVWGTNQPASYSPFKPGESFQFRSFTIHPFLKNHDASEPCSFRIEHNGISIGVFTDIGQPCENVISHLNQCHALFLETNYDEKMLWEGRYPYYLKRRVASNVGHLSNKQSFDLLTEHAGNQLSHVFLSHLSAENNTPETAYSTIKPLADKFNLLLTSRHDASEVVLIQ
ncbi:MAG: MBL fold metallo-hydrolase [Prolixibacteraceae bacterium]|nr:MBL fold metallo-hydrolase [Prolixibacteraceae bacterium]MBN2775246.1 MBL fold metallo-hydrolase [Prolixibacteraceae bacterium]